MMQNKKDKVSLNPIMTLMILIGLGIGATNPAEGNWVAVESLLSLRGIKYIFQSTVANFASFTPLSMLIIILIGIGIMDKSGFLKTTFSLITRKCQKKTITFVLALICIISSIGGDLAYVVMIPLSALLFYYGRRNPLHGIVISFAALTCGTGLSIFKTSVDSSLDVLTLDAAHILDSSYTLSYLGYFVIMTVAIFVLAAVITYVAEKFSVNDVPKYEFKDEKKEFVEEKAKISYASFFQKYSNVLMIVAAMICLNFTHMLINNYMINIISDIGGDAGSQGSATFIQAMVELPPMFGFALLLKKFRVDTLMVFSAIAWCVKDILILIAPNMTVYYFAMVFQMFSYAIIIPASVYFVDEYIASEDRNQGQAVMGAAGTVGGLFASFIGGFLLSLLSVRATLYVGIAVAVVGVLFMLIGMKKLKKA